MLRCTRLVCRLSVAQQRFISSCLNSKKMSIFLFAHFPSKTKIHEALEARAKIPDLSYLIRISFFSSCLFFIAEKTDESLSDQDELLSSSKFACDYAAREKMQFWSFFLFFFINPNLSLKFHCNDLLASQVRPCRYMTNIP